MARYRSEPGDRKTDLEVEALSARIELWPSAIDDLALMSIARLLS